MEFFSTKSTECPCYFTITGLRSRVYICSYNLEHNHELSINKQSKLDHEQETEAVQLLEFKTPVREVCRFLLQKYGLSVPRRRIYNLRQRRITHLSCEFYRVVTFILDDLDAVLARIDQTDRCIYQKDTEGNIELIVFSLEEHTVLFNQFPEVIFIDATHGTNRDKYVILYSRHSFAVGSCCISLLSKILLGYQER